MVNDINKGLVCSYCSQPTKRVKGIYGAMMKCEPCAAWVGVDKVTGEPLGRVLNKHDTEARKRLQYLIAELLTRRWFTDKGISKMLIDKGREHTANIYHLTPAAVQNILSPLEGFYEVRVNETFRNTESIKKLFKLHHYE